MADERKPPGRKQWKADREAHSVKIDADLWEQLTEQQTATRSRSDIINEALTAYLGKGAAKRGGK